MMIERIGYNMEKHELEVSNVTINKFYEIFENVSDMNGWEIVVNDGKFYMQRGEK